MFQVKKTISVPLQSIKENIFELLNKAIGDNMIDLSSHSGMED